MAAMPKTVTVDVRFRFTPEDLPMTGHELRAAAREWDHTDSPASEGWHGRVEIRNEMRRWADELDHLMGEGAWGSLTSCAACDGTGIAPGDD